MIAVDGATLDTRVSHSIDDTPPLRTVGNNDPVAEHMAARQFAQAADLLEQELAASADDSTDADASHAERIARHRLVAQLWDEHLGRFDRAIHHWLAAWQLDPQQIDALVAARTLAASVGDYAHVVTLYRTELDQLPLATSAAVRAQLWFALGTTELRRGAAGAAIAAFQTATSLHPSDTRAAEALAELYTRPSFADPEHPADAGPRRASAIYTDLGAAAFADGNVERCLGFLRRAVGIAPLDPRASDQLCQVLSSLGKWEELERVLEQRCDLTDDDDERIALLTRKVALHEHDHPNRTALIATLEELSNYQPPHGPAATSLRRSSLPSLSAVSAGMPTTARRSSTNSSSSPHWLANISATKPAPPSYCTKRY
jgi:tetratricopeptide (TPR) repeat protein